MPKRKNDNSDYDKLMKKFKRLEKKVRRRCRSRSRSNSRSSSRSSRRRSNSQVPEQTENHNVGEFNVAQLLDGDHTFNTPASEHHNTPAHDGPSSVGTAAAATTTDNAHMAGPSSQPIEMLDLSNLDEEPQPLPTEPVLDDAILEILGDDPTISNTYGAEIQKDLAIRLEHIATHGLTEELRKEITQKYLVPNNCKLINAPSLNVELEAISAAITKRDKGIQARQKQIATAISCISQTINKLITNTNADSETVKMLMDAERLLCDSQYNDSILRRNFITSSVKPEMKEQLQKTKPDSYLFGQALAETIKTAKVINRSSADLRIPAPKPPVNKRPAAASASTSNTSRNLNWKGPYPPRKQPNHPKTRNPPPPPPPGRNQPWSSSRASRQQPPRSRR
ncbi:unnamed protein product [Plutella xylostella]|uniref:(diamondback moth) hypothetical protein n=1 Tax=Plutella xylostella TaxID=51655 RepID=A0A8S4GCP8_PLUXY|nr:unnamed protein product [Plutella xylostella]